MLDVHLEIHFLVGYILFTINEIDNLVGGAAVIFFAGIGLVKVYKGNENLITD